MAKQQEDKKAGMENSEEYHVPVLLEEAIEALKIHPEGIYVDCTFGGGGHSRQILSRLGPTGKLIAFDQDADARQNLPDDSRLIFVPHNFRHLQRFLKLHDVSTVDGVLADLGVSSHQFDEPTRGFSTRFDADMDMRMDSRQEKTAFEVLSRYSQDQLQLLFQEYGEVTNSKTLASAIVQLRNSHSMKTIANFKKAIGPYVKGNPNKYFAQVFQALRIEVNDELGALKELLEQLPAILKPGGRVAIITFHSLEDRLVKNFFRDMKFEEAVDENPFQMETKKKELKVITKKPISPGDEELKRNPRSRSARLRVAEKIEQ